MYRKHFALNAKPFQITVDPKFLWLGEKHKEALATLRYGIIDNRGFLLLTGEVGTGKTILINRLISLLDIDTVVATLPDPDLESMDFYNLLADGFKMKRTFDSKGEFLIHLRDFLHHSHANDQQVLLVIDESQRLNHRLMEDIRVLSNIELQDKKLINIFFVGQQEFNSILMTPQNRALSQRITVRYHIEALDENETGEYIHHRLKVAGTNKRLFDKSAVSEVFQVSGGVPRLINIVCDHALLTAYAQGVHSINGKIIRECAEELRIPIQKPHANAATLGTSDAQTANDAKGKESSPEKTIGHKTDTESTGNGLKQQEKPKPAWRLAYAAAIVLLIGGIVFFISKYSGGPDPRYNEDDLTPSKYLTTLEQEKAKLEDRLKNSETKENIDASPDGDKAVPKGSEENVAQRSSSAQKATADKSADNKTSEAPSTDQVNVKNEAAKPLGRKEPETMDTTDHSAGGTQAIAPLPILKEKVNIQFSINSNEIDNTSYKILDQIATYLVQHPEVEIYVRGYTDNSGSSGYNKSVSSFRANAVKSYLIGKGVHPGSIEVFAMGSVDPIASNNTYEGRMQNRRVEIEFKR